MAYQPIYLPENFGINKGISELTQTLMRARQLDQERNQQRAQMLLQRERLGYEKQQATDQSSRQRHLDYQAALEKAERLTAAGNHDAAQSILAPFVTEMEQIGVAQSPQMPPQMQPQGGQQPQGGSAMPDSKEFPDQNQQMQQAINAAVSARAPQQQSPVEPPPVNGPLPFPNAGMIGDATQQFGMGGQPTAPTYPPAVARAQEQARDAERARKTLRFRDPSGQQVTLDPMAGETAAAERMGRVRQQNAAVFEQVSGMVPDNIRAYVDELKPMALMANEPLDAKDVFNYVRQRAGEDARTAAAQAEKGESREYDKWKTTTGWQEAEKRARIAARAAATRQENKPPSGSERTQGEAALATSGQMGRLADLLRSDPAAWTRYQNSLRSQKQTEATKGSSLVNPAVTLGRAVGLVPLSTEQRLQTPEEREIHALMAPLIAAKAREMDPVGALNETALLAGEQHLGLLSRSPEEMLSLVQQYQGNFQRKASAANPKVDPVTGATPKGGARRAGEKVSETDRKTLRSLLQQLRGAP